MCHEDNGTATPTATARSRDLESPGGHWRRPFDCNTPRGNYGTEQAGWLSWGSGNFRPPRLRCLTIAHGRCHHRAVSSEHRARKSVRCGPCLRFVLPSGVKTRLMGNWLPTWLLDIRALSSHCDLRVGHAGLP